MKIKIVELHPVMNLAKNSKLVWFGLVIFLAFLGQRMIQVSFKIKIEELGAYLGIIIGIITLVLGAYQTIVTVNSNEENRSNNIQQGIDSLKKHIDEQLQYMDKRVDDGSNLLTSLDVRSNSLERSLSKYELDIDKRLYRLEQQFSSLRYDYQQLQIHLKHHEEQIGHKETQIELFTIQKELANLNVVTSAQTRYNSIGMRTDRLQQELLQTKKKLEIVLKNIDILPTV